MKTFPCVFRISLIALLAGIGLALVPAAQAAPDLQPLADKHAPLPLTVSFTKGTPGENSGPYALILKNTSEKSLKVKATILYSVQSHNRAKSKELPAHEIKAGESWTIDDLAVADKVTLKAHGHAELEVVVPPGGK